MLRGGWLGVWADARARAQAGRHAAVDGRTQAGQSAAAQQAQKSK